MAVRKIVLGLWKLCDLGHALHSQCGLRSCCAPGLVLGLGRGSEPNRLGPCAGLRFLHLAPGLS